MTIDIIPLNGQTWLICGGRNFADQDMFDSAMSDFLRLRGRPEQIIQGGANGADRMASGWAGQHAIPCRVFYALWTLHGKMAGPIRNQRMLDEGKPDFVVAFPGGRGTTDMIKRSREAGIDVAEIRPKFA